MSSHEDMPEHLKTGMLIDCIERAEEAAVLGVVQAEGESYEAFVKRVDIAQAKGILNLLLGLNLITPKADLWPRGTILRQRFADAGYHAWADQNEVAWEMAEVEYIHQNGGPMAFPQAFILLREKFTEKVLSDEGIERPE